MKIFVANLFYFVGVIACTYVFQWMLILWIGWSRFTAADFPPGDISFGLKIVYSVGFPLGNFIFLTIVFFLYRSILNAFNIKIKKLIPVIINIIITIYLIGHITFIVFDLFMYEV